jgi:transposase
MDSMTHAPGVVVGVDAHTDTHDVAVLDDCGRLLARATFAADAAGYRALRAWIERFAPVAAIGVESTGSYAAGLVRHLRAEGLEVLEVNQPHPHTRRRRGKSDPIDAELAARHVLAANRLVVAKDTSGIVEAIRQLRVARDGAVKARTAALNALSGLIVTAPRGSAPTADGAQEHPRSRAAVRTLAPRPATAPRARAGGQGRAAIARTTHHRARRRDQAARPAARATPRRGRADHHQRVAVGTGHAATLLVTAGQNIERLRHEAAFAALCAASPIPVSSGRTDRHRLNYGGDRDANRALHMIAVCRLRHCERTRAYAARRTTEGKTKTEIIRCLKRYIARELYHALISDLLPQPASSRPRDPIISVTCGAGPIGRTITT